jgi:hypothetical protein
MAKHFFVVVMMLVGVLATPQARAQASTESAAPIGTSYEAPAPAPPPQFGTQIAPNVYQVTPDVTTIPPAHVNALSAAQCSQLLVSIGALPSDKQTLFGSIKSECNGTAEASQAVDNSPAATPPPPDIPLGGPSSSQSTSGSQSNSTVAPSTTNQ